MIDIFNKKQLAILEAKIKELESQVPNRIENLDLLQYCYTDSSGHKFYEFKSMEYLVRARAKIFFMVLNNADLAITTNDLIIYINEQDSLVNKILVAKKDSADLKSLQMQSIKNSAVMIERLTLSADYNTLLQIAKCLFLLENEPLFVSESEFQRFGDLKQSAWEKDNNALGFFLQKAIRHVDSFKDISEDDLKELVTWLMRKNLAF